MMKIDKRILIVIGVCVISLALTTVPGRAQGGGQPLPPLPDRAVIDKMIKDSQGPTLTAIRAPSAALGDVKTGPFGDLTQRADVNRAIHAIGPDSAGPLRTVIPLVGAEKGMLQPDTKTPDDGLPAQVIGVSYESGKGGVVAVAVWKDKGSKKPTDIRFYQRGKPLSTDTAYAISVRKFKGDRSGKVSAGDQGAIIAARETCYTFGLDQVCYGPQKFVPDERIASVVEKTAGELSDAYDIQVKFDLDGGVAEIIGSDQRTRCDRSFAASRQAPVKAPSDCSVNLIFTAVTKIREGQPIGLFRVLRDINMKVYDAQGNPAGKLPAGSYLVLDATSPDVVDTPGAPGALFLVSADGSNNFLIPCQVAEGFGGSDDPDAVSRRGQAAIKDAFIGGRGF
jgi:hypothetical protein